MVNQLELPAQVQKFACGALKLNRYGKRTFKFGAVKLWNSITDELLKLSNDITIIKERFTSSMYITVLALFISIL